MPQLEVHIKLQYTAPIIIALKRSRLWPLHLRSATTLTRVGSGNREYVPRVDTPTNGPAIPKLSAQHKGDILGLRPGEIGVVRVSFRPYGERYEYEMFKDRGVERYGMMFPIGMQVSEPGEEYGIGIGEVAEHAYMLGNLEEIVSETAGGGDWKAAEGSLDVVPGMRCRFRVED